MGFCAPLQPDIRIDRTCVNSRVATLFPSSTLNVRGPFTLMIGIVEQ
jgi:hypothetical protein